MSISSSSELPRSSSIVFSRGKFAFLLLASCSCFCKPSLGATLAPEDAGLQVNMVSQLTGFALWSQEHYGRPTVGSVKAHLLLALSFSERLLQVDFGFSRTVEPFLTRFGSVPPGECRSKSVAIARWLERILHQTSETPIEVLRVQMKSEEYAFTCDMGEESYALRVVLSGHFICMTATQY
jgi:hypothetical protein